MYARLVSDGTPNGQRNYFHDAFYRLIANASGEFPPPNWVDDSYYYLPFDLPVADGLKASSNSTEITGYSAITRGFKIDLNCSEIRPDSKPTRLLFEFQESGEAKVQDDRYGGGELPTSKPQSQGSGIVLGILHQNAGRNITCGAIAGSRARPPMRSHHCAAT